MAKILVTATEDFFDRANNITRLKGNQFEIKEEFVKTYGKQIDVAEKKKIKSATEKKHIKKPGS